MDIWPLNWTHISIHSPITQVMGKIAQEFESKKIAIEERIAYSFLDENLLKRALTHKSLSNEERQKQNECEDQDALRTLGDAVLKTILCDRLINSGYKTKGEITITKSAIENREFLAQLGRKFELSECILPGKGAEEQKHHEELSVIAETLEAIIGAIYLDQGFDVAKKVVSGWYEPYRDLLKP
jgi:ribonuclease-3